MKCILVTDYVSEPHIELAILKNKFRVVTRDCDFNNSDVEGVLVWHDKINNDFLDRFPNVKFIQRYGVGFDNIDLLSCKKNNVKFANNPDYGVEEVSNTAIAYILYLSRALGQYKHISEMLMKKNDQNLWQEITGLGVKRLSEEKLLIIGCGRIGSAIVRKAKELFKEIIIYDPKLPSGIEKSLGCSRVDKLRDGLKLANVISLNCLLNSDTKDLVNSDFLSNCNNDVLLIITARGGLFENDA